MGFQSRRLLGLSIDPQLQTPLFLGRHSEMNATCFYFLLLSREASE